MMIVWIALLLVSAERRFDRGRERERGFDGGREPKFPGSGFEPLSNICACSVDEKECPNCDKNKPSEGWQPVYWVWHEIASCAGRWCNTMDWMPVVGSPEDDNSFCVENATFTDQTGFFYRNKDRAIVKHTWKQHKESNHHWRALNGYRKLGYIKADTKEHAAEKIYERLHNFYECGDDFKLGEGFKGCTSTQSVSGHDALGRHNVVQEVDRYFFRENHRKHMYGKGNDFPESGWSFDESTEEFRGNNDESMSSFM